MNRESRRRPAIRIWLVATLFTLVTVACTGSNVEHVYPEKRGKRGSDPYPTQPQETIFGPGGFNVGLLGDTTTGKDKEGGGEGINSIGVNSFLWRASLDTMSFMPLTSADPFGGVIITDWYSPTETPDERFKATIYILERQLTANGVRVSVFRQSRAQSADWRDVAIDQETALALEDAILTRARQLRVSAVGSQ